MTEDLRINGDRLLSRIEELASIAVSYTHLRAHET